MAADNDKTVVFSTHIASDLERIANKVAILHDGKIRCFMPHPLYMLACLGMTLSIMLISFYSLQSTFFYILGCTLFVAMFIVKNMHIGLITVLAVLGACLVIISPWLPKHLNELKVKHQKLQFLISEKAPWLWFKDEQAASPSKESNISKLEQGALQSTYHLLTQLFKNRHATWQLILLYPLLLVAAISLATANNWFDVHNDPFLLLIMLVTLSLGDCWLPLYRQVNQRKPLLAQLRLLPINTQQSRLRQQLFLYIICQQEKLTLAFTVFFSGCYVFTSWSWQTCMLLFMAFLLCSMLAQIIILFALHNNRMVKQVCRSARILRVFLSLSQ